VNYFVPNSIQEALFLLSENKDAKILAGGTDLTVQMREQCNYPPCLIDITKIRELSGIRKETDSIVIGAAVTIAEIADSAFLPRALIQGARSIGSPQIRNLGTIGGNICNASPCGDTLPGLLVLSAHFLLASPEGTRKVRADEFFLGPKKTILKENEILTVVELPKQFLQGTSSFRMIGKRNGQVISQVNGAVWAEGNREKIEGIRIAFGSAAPVPVRLSHAESCIKGEKLTREIIEQGMKLIRKDILPITDVRASEEYRFFAAEGIFFAILSEIRDTFQGEL